MTTRVFEEWVELHCTHTGATGETAAVLLANERVVCERWRATYAEISECTTRLIEAGRVPKFANEHMNALLSELRRLREERLASLRNQELNQPDPDCDCPRCVPPNGSPRWQALSARLGGQLRTFGMVPPRGKR